MWVPSVPGRMPSTWPALLHKASLVMTGPSQPASPSILRELVPQNLTRLMSLEEWKKVLVGGWGGALSCGHHRGPAHVWLWKVDWVCHPRPSGSSRCSGRGRASGGGPARLWSPLRPHWPWLPEHPPGLANKHKDKSAVEEAKVAFLK